MSFFISEALAEAAPQAAGQPPAFLQFLPLVLLAVVFYFLLWRPQNKRSKDHKNLLSSLEKGTEVLTNGGIVGKIVKVDENFVVLQVADNMELKFQKAAIAASLPKGTMKSI
ncbi:MAG TPA: preprotein translocase subunit YajC [Pseudomonadales bacterium]